MAQRRDISIPLDVIKQIFEFIHSCGYFHLFHYLFIIYSLPEIEEWYRLLYRMVGNVIRNILSFRVRKDGIDQLQLRVAEMICLCNQNFRLQKTIFNSIKLWIWFHLYRCSDLRIHGVTYGCQGPPCQGSPRT